MMKNATNISGFYDFSSLAMHLIQRLFFKPVDQRLYSENFI